MENLSDECFKLAIENAIKETKKKEDKEKLKSALKPSNCCNTREHDIYHSCGKNEFRKEFDDYLKYFEENEVKYLILMENPLRWGTYVYNADGKGGYISSINTAFFKKKSIKKRLDLWKKKGILVVDIYNLFTVVKDGSCEGFPISSLVRGELQKPICSTIYSVFRLKVSFEMLSARGIKISANCKLALSMPEKTSLPLLNHYGNNPTETLKVGKSIDFAKYFRELNCHPFYSLFPYTIIPRHKVNTMGASNQAPDSDLLKIALDL